MLEYNAEMSVNTVMRIHFFRSCKTLVFFIILQPHTAMIYKYFQILLVNNFLYHMNLQRP